VTAEEHATGDTVDRDEVIAAAETGFVGVLLVVGRTRASEMLADLPDEAIEHPAHRWVVAGVRAALADGAEPDPVTVAAAADRAGLRPPSSLRGQPLSALARLYSTAPVPAAGGHYLELVKANYVRRAIAAAGRVIAEAAWGGTLPDAREVIVTEGRAAIALVDKIAEASSDRGKLPPSRELPPLPCRPALSVVGQQVIRND